MRLIYPCSLSASISTSYFHCKLNIGCPSNLSVSNTVHRICLQQEDNTSGPLQLMQNLRVRSRTSDNSQVSTYLNRLCCILGKCPVLCRSKWPSHQNTNLLDVKQTNKSHATTGTNHNLKTTTTRQSRLNSKKRRKIGYTL